jgi:putative pyruvate formate lyase activating enzyme
MVDPLPHYHAILAGRERASFLRLREHSLPLIRERSLDDLWSSHREEMGRFHDGTVGVGDADLLLLKVEISSRMLRSCHLCERRCGVDRSKGQRGHCGVLEPMVSSAFLHMGEEPPLVPSYTVFFAGCILDCVFCQNCDISTDPTAGIYMEPGTLARRLEIACQRGNARNINWVGGDPTPALPYLLRVLAELDISIPQIWNSNMYLSRESMDLLDGTMDLYLTDLKYGNDRCSERLSNAPRYWEVVTRNHILAAKRGDVIVRHLVMPGHLQCCTYPVLEWLSDNMPGTPVNVMSQYRPMHRASEFPEISVPLGMRDFLLARDRANELGLKLVE